MKGDVAIAQPSLCPRGSVGAIVQDESGNFLVLRRKAYPPGLAFVAGHREGEERPEQTLVRELYEESGITADAYTLVLHQTFPNPCKSGFHAHEWWVYEVSAWDGTPSLQEPDKHEFVRFMSPHEIQGYLASGDVDPAWGTFLFPALSLMPQYATLPRNH